MRRAALAVSLVAILATSRVAYAGDDDRARALFEEAGQLEREGKWSAAQDRLRAALRIRETPHLHYALGWALENDDRLVAAKGEYESAVQLGRESAGAEEPIRLASARLAVLEKTTPVLKVRVAGARAGARVIIDGREHPRAGDDVAARVDPGSHVVRVERDDAGSFEKVVYVGRGAVSSIDVGGNGGRARVAANGGARRGGGPTGPGSATTSTTARADRAGRPPAGRDALSWVLLGGGLASLTAGGALLVSASGDGDGPSRDARIIGGAGAGVVGLAASTAGAILLLRQDEPGGAGPRAAVTPVRGGAMAAATFAF